MKYIDADKLITEIRKLRSESCISESDDYYEYAKSEIIDIITSLQQEQSDVDLDGEIDMSIRLMHGVHSLEDNKQWYKGRYENIRVLARHFYELGLKAGKEE